MNKFTDDPEKNSLPFEGEGIHNEWSDVMNHTQITVPYSYNPMDPWLEAATAGHDVIFLSMG